MKIVCAWCEAEGVSGDMGDALPLEDERVSHSICERHMADMQRTMEKQTQMT